MTQAGGESRLDAWKGLLRTHALLTAVLERELRDEQGLALTWYDVLVQLQANGGRLRMHDLARAVLLSRAGLTRLVDRMANAGLVDRVPCNDDRRGTFVELTERGLAALRRAAPGHLRGIDRHFSRYLSEDEARLLTTVFARVEAAAALDWAEELATGAAR